MTIEAYPETVFAATVYRGLAVVGNDRIFPVVITSSEKRHSSLALDISHFTYVQAPILK